MRKGEGPSLRWRGEVIQRNTENSSPFTPSTWAHHHLCSEFSCFPFFPSLPLASNEQSRRAPKRRLGQKSSFWFFLGHTPFIFSPSIKPQQRSPTPSVFVPLCERSTDVTYRIKGHSGEGNLLAGALHRSLGDSERGSRPTCELWLHTCSPHTCPPAPFFPPSHLFPTSPKVRIMPQLPFLREL